MASGTIRTENSSKIVDIIFDEFANELHTQFERINGKEKIAQWKSEMNYGWPSISIYEEQFKLWKNGTGIVINILKSLIEKYAFNDKCKYLVIMKAIDYGYSGNLKFNGESLFTPNLYKYVNAKSIARFIENLNFKWAADILIARNDLTLFNEVRKSCAYNYQEGYAQRNLIEIMDLPSNIDFSREVPSNKSIEIFNCIYDDACINEKWPTKIRSLVYGRLNEGNDNEGSLLSGPNFSGYMGILNPKKHLNQTNLISLAKSLYKWGAGFDTPTYERVQEFYNVIKIRMANGDLTLYDYQDGTLANLKIKLSNKINFQKTAPFTNYVLEYFNNPPIDEDTLDVKVLKQLIKFNSKV